MTVPRFTIITSNKHKLAEFRRLLPADLAFDAKSLHLDEIQTLDSDELVEHKARQAYALVNKPVVVEDVTAGLDELKGLPGPFIKFFEERLGQSALYQLAGHEAAATVTCTIGYFDGTQLLIARGVEHGTVGPPRGGNGFGFDIVFRPQGSRKTFAEMTPDEKDAVSHRSKAVAEFIRLLPS